MLFRGNITARTNMPHRVQPPWNNKTSLQQADQSIATVERHAASHRHVADAVHNLTQALQTAVEDGVSDGKRHVNTVARYTAEHVQLE